MVAEVEVGGVTGGATGGEGAMAVSQQSQSELVSYMYSGKESYHPVNIYL